MRHRRDDKQQRAQLDYSGIYKIGGKKMLLFIVSFKVVQLGDG